MFVEQSRDDMRQFYDNVPLLYKRPSLVRHCRALFASLVRHSPRSLMCHSRGETSPPAVVYGDFYDDDHDSPLRPPLLVHSGEHHHGSGVTTSTSSIDPHPSSARMVITSGWVSSVPTFGSLAMNGPRKSVCIILVMGIRFNAEGDGTFQTVLMDLSIGSTAESKYYFHYF
ncbi:hypothetical protein J6590_081017 [Homalodisca vitripennis]|nr:hypothetical protein J6590_081017 [Homalodisca vitripennis]